MKHTSTLLPYFVSSPASRAMEKSACPGKPAVSGALLSTLFKQAQELGEASKRPSRYAASIAEMNERKRQEAAAAAAAEADRRKVAPVNGLTGDDYYDSLPDVLDRQILENTDDTMRRYLASRDDLVQVKDQDTVQREVDAAGPTKSWGDNFFLRNLLGRIAGPLRLGVHGTGSLLLGANNLLAGRGHFWDEQKGYWKDYFKDYDDVSHDIANNFQLQAEGARHGAETIARAADHYLRPSTYMNDASSLAAAYSRKNAWTNADTAHHARANNIVNNFRDSDLAHPERSTLGAINYGGNAAAGEFAGGELATAGIGGVAKGVSKAINYGTKALSGAVRGSKLVPVGANVGLGARTVQFGRNALARGIDGMGATLATPFNALSRLTIPGQFSTLKRAPVVLARDAASTAKAAFRPAAALYRSFGSPGAATLRAINQHPFRMLWAAGRRGIGATRDLWRFGRKAIRNPEWAADAAVQAAKNLGANAGRATGRWLWNTAAFPVKHPWQAGKATAGWARSMVSPISRHVFGKDRLWRTMAAYNAANNMSQGNYGRAFGNIGAMGAYAANPWFGYALFANDLLNAYNGRNNSPAEDEWGYEEWE